MASYTLDDIRSAADRKYASTDIAVGDGVVRLLNPLRLSKEKRTALMAVQNELNAANDSDEANDVDQVALIQRAVRVVAETDGQATRLIDAIGDDLAVLAEVFSTYGESQQVGEASASVA